ncbi:MAG: potassium transporter Kup [Thiotrichales bacterium]|jgi:KUP system potassium uptake protein|nr:potassium transporter Kup [Thiotrichales bacterium]
MTSEHKKHGLAAATLAALGVVYGDIGTSPLYTVQTVFSESTGIAATPDNIIGATSAIFWALMLVVTLKYVLLILRADNHGEGGIMALVALATGSSNENNTRRKRILLLLGVFGLALFYGDSIITPAISVLGAMEGIKVVSPQFESYILPLTIGILVGLFLVQKRGTGTVGRWFGPIMIVWFVALGVVGLYNMVSNPEILSALNPLYAIHFLWDRGAGVFLAVGAIVLALTGAEALYADMGHFGRKAIQIAWSLLVLPGLALTYMGQGALLLANPSAVSNPFYMAFPEPLLLPAIVLATAATVIASQAVISGAYSLTKQAIQLGYLPRMQLFHSSALEEGQIYMPVVNWLLMSAVVVMVLVFGSSAALASAYGVAVTGLMVITTVLTFFVVRYTWGYPLWLAGLATGTFIIVDLLLFSSCAMKFAEGGWLPFVVALLLLNVMLTWKRGRAIIKRQIRRDNPLLQDYLLKVSTMSLAQVEHTAVFLALEKDVAPRAMVHNVRHNRVWHSRNVILTVSFDHVPWVPENERLSVVQVSPNVWQVRVRYGFMNTPDIPKALKQCAAYGLVINQFDVTYFLSRETVLTGSPNGMAQWRGELFALMSRNAESIVNHFQVPDNCVLELGSRVMV